MTFTPQEGTGTLQGQDEVRPRVAPLVLYSKVAPSERVDPTEETNTTGIVARLYALVAAGGAVLEPIDGIVQ